MSITGMSMQVLTVLRRARERQALSKAEMARRLDVDRGYFSRLEDGHHVPGFDRLMQWAGVLGAHSVLMQVPEDRARVQEDEVAA